MLKRCFLFLILFVITSCSKFDDGPWISFRSQQERLQGEWLLKSFTVDGVDSLQALNDYFGTECKFSFFKWNNQVGLGLLRIAWGDSTSNHYFVEGDQEGFNKDLLTVTTFKEDSSSTLYPLAFLENSGPDSGISKWQATKLKYTDLWFEMDENSKHYELHLENIKKF